MIHKILTTINYYVRLLGALLINGLENNTISAYEGVYLFGSVTRIDIVNS